jgi:hypothetical protein
VDKARIFPGCWFVVGADTAERIVDPRFYGGDRDSMLLALDAIRRKGCRFLVAPRLADPKAGAGPLRTLDDILPLVPRVLQGAAAGGDGDGDSDYGCTPVLLAQGRSLPRGPLFQPIPAFRADISSTLLRTPL